MDELAAAVAVRKFTIDGFAGQHVGQRCICGTVAGKHSRRLLQSAKAENKENRKEGSAAKKSVVKGGAALPATARSAAES